MNDYGKSFYKSIEGLCDSPSPEEATMDVAEINVRIIMAKQYYVALAQGKEDRKAYLASQYIQHMAGMHMEQMGGMQACQENHAIAQAQVMQGQG